MWSAIWDAMDSTFAINSGEGSSTNAGDLPIVIP
jgi:hypothetical protein